MIKYVVASIIALASMNVWASQVADYFFHFLTVAVIVSTTVAVLKVRSMPSLNTLLLRFIGFGVTFWIVMFALMIAYALVYQFSK
jgi:hypothetical protein